jgi:hypothetical protein
MSVSSYFILQTYDESAAYAFKVSTVAYKPLRAKMQRIQSTITGKLDIQNAPIERSWSYGVKLNPSDTGTFEVEAGTIVTATEITWGTWTTLRELFDINTPPDTQLRFRDFDGEEYWVYLVGDLRPELRTPAIDTYMIAPITLRGANA